MQTLGIFLNKWSIPITSISALFGGSLWVTALFQQIEQTALGLADTKKQVAKLEDHIRSQNERLARIEGKLDMLMHRMKSRNRR